MMVFESRISKVTNVCVETVVQKDVLRLKVAMNDPTPMQILHGIAHVIGDGKDEREGERRRRGLIDEILKVSPRKVT